MAQVALATAERKRYWLTAELTTGTAMTEMITMIRRARLNSIIVKPAVKVRELLARVGPR